MPGKFKVDVVLAGASEEDRAAYIELERRKDLTVDDLWAWFTERGLKVGRVAVWKHRRSMEEDLKDLRAAAESSRAWVQVARDSGAVAFSEAAVTKLSRELMETLFKIQQDEDSDPDLLVKLSVALKNATGTQQTLADIRADERKQAREEAAAAAAAAMTTAQKQKRAITDDDIAEVRKAVFG